MAEVVFRAEALGAEEEVVGKKSRLGISDRENIAFTLDDHERLSGHLTRGAEARR